MKSYYYYTKNTNISYPEIINHLAENSANKYANEKILIPFDYLELKKPYQ